MLKFYRIDPVGKPRMTRSDKWKLRPCVMRYRQFKDEVRNQSITVSESRAHIIFILPMPDSWSKKKKAKMVTMPHQSTPDKDNLEKALLDAIFENDSHVWDNRITKIWGYYGAIMINSDILPPIKSCRS